jgi:poly-gamma-glutamate capsule biosynthesis protein CapA/YwtB (metallophosphatase superfamily)
MSNRIFLLTSFSIAAIFSAEAQDTTRLSMLFLGDIMQHDSQIADAYDPITKKYNYHPCFQYVKPYTKAADLAIGNLELTLAGPPYKGYPQFGAPDELLVALKDMGMDVLVTANNHCVDRAQKGLERTIEMLDSFNILHTGTFRDEAERSRLTPLLIERNGFRLALLNYTFGTNGLPVFKPNIVNLMDKEQIGKDLAKAKELKPDATIVFTHWGTEYQSLPSAWQKDVAKFCFDHGANLVIGAHPHVIQPMEWNRKENKLIVYSLGNFVSGQRKRYTDGGAMIRVELEKVKMNDSLSFTGIDTAGYVLQWVYRTVDQGKNYYVLPVPTAEGKVESFIQDLESREAFKTFAADSRELLSANNIAIQELNSGPEWFLEFTGNYADTVRIREVLHDAAAIQITDGPSPLFQIGPFTQTDADYYRRAIGLPVSRLKRRNR